MEASGERDNSALRASLDLRLRGVVGGGVYKGQEVEDRGGGGGRESFFNAYSAGGRDRPSEGEEEEEEEEGRPERGLH